MEVAVFFFLGLRDDPFHRFSSVSEDGSSQPVFRNPLLAKGLPNHGCVFATSGKRFIEVVVKF